MDVTQLAVEYLLNLPSVGWWAEAQALLRHAAANQPRAWRLPALACEAVGGGPKRAIPGVAAIAAAQISIILIDDMLDADPARCSSWLPTIQVL